MPVKINQNKNVNKLLSIISLPDQLSTTTITTTETTSIVNTSSSILLKRINGPTHISAANILNQKQQQHQEYYSNYYYLGLLIIPFLILLLILILICSFGRTFQVYLYNTYSIILLPCFRPDTDNCNNNLIEQTNETNNNNKLYDLTICYNEYDELWLNEQFMPQLTEFDRGYKIHKLMLYQRLNFHLSETCKRVLTSSKRVLLVFSEKFLNEEWNNKIFHEFIKHNLYETDLNCIIIIVNLSNINEYKSKLALNELKLKSTSRRNKKLIQNNNNNNNNNTFIISRLRTYIKYSVGLNNIEYLNWTDYHFWKHLNYILPFKSLNQITKISKYSYDITNSCSGSSSSSSCEINKNKNKNRISSIRSLSKKRSRKISEFNIPRTIAIKTDDDDINNNSNNINSSSSLPSIKKIIVPIPNEMRTQLGSFNKLSLEQQKNEIFLTNSSKSMNIINSSIRLQQQQQQQQQPLQDKLFSKTRLQQSDNQMTSNKINKKNNNNNRYRRKSDTSSNNE